MSVKHQVICDVTAMVGVMKQENKATGEMQETIIKFGKGYAMAAAALEIDQDQLIDELADVDNI